MHVHLPVYMYSTVVMILWILYDIDIVNVSSVSNYICEMEFH